MFRDRASGKRHIVQFDCGFIADKMHCREIAESNLYRGG